METILGVTLPAGQVDRDRAVANLTAALDANETRAADLERLAAGHVDGETARLGALATNQQSLVEGQINSALSTLDHRAGTQAGKIVKQLNRQLGNVYNHAYPYGAVFPTNEQAVYGLATNDVLGSMGIAPAVVVPPLPAAAPGTAPPLGLPPPVGAPPNLPPLQPPPATPPVVPPTFTPGPPGPGGKLNPGYCPPCPPGGRPPDADGNCGCPPPPPLPKPCAGGVTPCYAYPDPTSPTGYVNWQGQTCGACPDGSCTAFSPCQCPPGSPWMGELLGCGANQGTPPPAPPAACPPPVIQVNCGQCGCNQSTPAGPFCPEGFHWEPDPTSPTLKGGGGGGGGFSPTLRGGGGGDLPLARRTAGAARDVGLVPEQAQPCPPLVRSSVAQFFTPPDFVGLRFGVPSAWPWLDNSRTPAGFHTETCQVKGCHFDPPSYATVTLYFPAGWSLLVRQVDGVLIAARGAAPSPGWDALACDVVNPPPGPAPGAGSPSAGGKCVPDPPRPPAQCPVKPDLACGPDLDPHAKQLALGTGDECQAIQDVIKKLAATTPNFGDWVGMRSEKPGRPPTEEEKALGFRWSGSSEPVLPGLVNRLADWLQKTILAAAEGLGIDSPELLKTAIWRGVLRLINHWTGAIPAQLLVQLDQVSNTLHPSLLPTAADADRAYQADTITAEEWECWVRAHGHHPDPRKRVRYAERKKLTFHQALLCYRRQLIDQGRYQQAARQDGVVTDPDLAELELWENYYPGIGEGFRWAGRQLFDQTVVDRFGLDDGFEQLWESAFKDVADAHGVSRTWAQKHWEQHWEHPGQAILFEAVRRLRKGKVADDLVFTEEDLDAALRQEGYPDYWVKRIKALAYHKPTRLDMRRLYQLHQIDEEGLKEQLRDFGFEKDYADQLIQMWKTDRDLKEYHQAGFPAGTALVTGYARGEITSHELSDLAERQSYYDGQVDEIKEAAGLARERAGRRAAITGVKRRFTAGLVGAAEAAAELAVAGVDADEIESLMQWWDQVKRSHPKQVPAATLCTWRKDHLIGPGEQMEALLRLGYNQPDARNIVADCTLQIARAQAKAEQTAEAQAVKAAAKAAKAEAAAMKARARGRGTRPRASQPGP